MLDKIKTWLASLLSDSQGLPSTRLHLAWIITFLICFYVIYQTVKTVQVQVDLVWALIICVTTMSGLSVVDKDKISSKIKELNEK